MNVIYKRVIAMLFALLVVVAAAPTAAQMSSDTAILTIPKTSKKIVLSSIAIDNLRLLRKVLSEQNMFHHLQTLQAIMLVESRAGTGGQVGLPTAHWTRRSYGLMQLTIPTAQVILRDNPDVRRQYFGDRAWQSISQTEMKQFLIDNRAANIQFGAILFELYLKMTDNEWARAVAGYNMGIGNALKRKDAPKAKYVADVRTMQKLEEQIAVLADPKPELVVAEPSVIEDASEVLPENKEKNYGEDEGHTKNTSEERQERSGGSKRAQTLQDWSGYDYTPPTSD